MQEQIDLHSTQIGRLTEKTTKDLLSGGSNFSRYLLYLSLQKLYRTPASDIGPEHRKRTRSETEEESLTPLPPPTSLAPSIIEVSNSCTYQLFSNEVKRVLACFQDHLEHLPTLFPDFALTERASFSEDCIHIHFPTIRGFYNMVGLTDSQLSKKMLLNTGKRCRVLGSFAFDYEDDRKPAYMLPSRSWDGCFATTDEESYCNSVLPTFVPVLRTGETLLDPYEESEL